MGHICVHAQKFQCFCDPQRSFITGKPGTLGDWVENRDHVSLGDLPSTLTRHSTMCSWSSVHWVTQTLDGLEAHWIGHEAHTNPLLSFPHAAEAQHLKSVVAQPFPPKWPLWFVWCSFVDLSPLSSSREVAKRDLAWPRFLTSWDNIFIPGWSGSVLLDVDHSASQNRSPCLAPMN